MKDTSTRSGRYVGPPGDPTTYWLPRDFVEWEQSWNRYKGIDEPSEAPERAESRKHEQAPMDPERKARFNEAVAYIRDYTGTWGFILDLRSKREWGTKWFRLSDRQVEVVLASKARDAERAKPRRESGRDLSVLPLGRTHAAVDNDEGGVTFLIIDRPDEKSKWHGWAFVKQFIGGVGEGRKLGSQRPGQTYCGQWANLIDKVIADPMAAVVRFGKELGICGVCSLPLTNEESREAGIGPVCRRKMA